MKKWSTIIYAKNPLTGSITEFAGPLIEAPSQKLAFEYCQNNGLGYCFIGDEVVSIIPTKADGLTPDWSKRVDFDIEQRSDATTVAKAIDPKYQETEDMVNELEIKIDRLYVDLAKSEIKQKETEDLNAKLLEVLKNLKNDDNQWDYIEDKYRDEIEGLIQQSETKSKDNE